MTHLKVFRLESGLSQVELSEAAQVPRYVIQLAEQAIRLPTVAYRDRLAEALGVDQVVLFPERTDSGDNGI